ncbi:MAG: response regulator [Patescibacteria group bacterium]|jgi:DNA-binding response OmpR family regulator
MALSTPTTKQPRPQRIIVVDDDAPVSNLFKKELTALGYNVEVASNGEEGLQLAQRQKPNLMILDLIMPKLGGRELLEKLRAGKTTFSIPVMIVSHLDSNIEREKCAELGVECFIVKHKSSVADIINQARTILQRR